MSVADKYMSQVGHKSFKFIPPQFNMGSFRVNDDVDNNNVLNLFPSETAELQMYCYYNQLNGCNNMENNVTRNYEETIESEITVNIPSPMQLLRKYSYELDDENQRSEVESIYSNIEKNHHNVIDSLIEYKIPVPIAKVITKKIVKLSLEYSKECNKI